MERNIEAPHDWIVTRERISGILAAGMAYPFVTVVAGPGYGKSTAVMDFARTTDRKLVWHHLLAIDNSPDYFWSRLIEAVQRELPGLAKVMAKGKFPETLGEFYAFIRNLTGELLKGEEILFVFDSAECITNEVIFLFFEGLIKAELKNLGIIYISNNRPQNGGMMGAGNHIQIGPAELQFNPREVMELFEKCGRTIGPEECAKLLEMTEGWPLALYLMASQPNTAHAFGETSNFHIIAELFQQNYFAGYEPAFRDLLIKLSFFDGVPLGLIQAIDTENVIKTVEQMTRNIFISYDYNQNRFYFQKMYRDFLSQMRDMLGRREKEEIYSKCGDWFRGKGWYLDALFCYWEIRDYDRYMKAMTHLPEKRKSRRTVNIVLEHLNLFPEEYTINHEAVDFYRGLLYMNDLEIRRAKEILLSLAGRMEKQNMPLEKQVILRDVYMTLTEISFFQSSLDGLKYAQKALTFPPHAARDRSFNSMIVGNNDVFFLPDNAPGRLDFMFGYIDRFLLLSERLYYKSGRGFAELFTAEASFLAQSFGDVRENSAKAIYKAMEAGQGDIVLNALALQLRLAIFQGDYQRCRRLREKIVDFTDRTGNTELYPLRDCILGLLYINLGDLSKVPHWLASGERLPTDIPMDTGRDRIIHAFLQYLEGHYSTSFAALIELDVILIEHRQWYIQISNHILKAACKLRLGDREKAVQNLWDAYDMTWQNNILVCFAEFGKVMEELIELARSQKELKFDEQWLDNVQAASAAWAKRNSAMRKLHKNDVVVHKKRMAELTPRELEVLYYLSNGLTRKEMSYVLKISLHGIKKHITNVYDKLGADNRVEAVNIANSYGILDTVKF